MKYHFKLWSLLLKEDTIHWRALMGFENDMKALYGANILDQWVRWSEKLKVRGMYK